MICLNSKHNLLYGIRAAINCEIVLLQIKALRLKKKMCVALCTFDAEEDEVLYE